MWATHRRRTVKPMPRRAAIDPQGWYHVSSRGSYGRALFPTPSASERFLQMYARVSHKYAWTTIAWVLRHNHHHFVIRLTAGGLSAGMRELHGGYSRWFHLQTGETGQGHLVRHAFFARQLVTDADLLVACCYVDLNPVGSSITLPPERGEWCGYRATIGLEHPRAFHRPSELLELLDRRPSKARDAYRNLVHERLAIRRQVLSPNDGDGGQRG